LVENFYNPRQRKERRTRAEAKNSYQELGFQRVAEAFYSSRQWIEKGSQV
jgi:hypothetical protein